MLHPWRSLFRGELSGHGTHHFLGRANGNLQGCLAERVKPLQSCACQVESMACVVGRLAVDQIAHHGVSQCRGVPPDLMGASCEQVPFDEASMVVNTPSSPTQAFECGLRWLAIDGEIHSAAMGGQSSTNPSVVRLCSKVPIGLKFSQCIQGFRHTNRSPGAKIQSVYRLPKLAIAIGKLLLHGMKQCVRSPSVRAHASRFQHNTMVVIAEENVELHDDVLPGERCEFDGKCADL